MSRLIQFTVPEEHARCLEEHCKTTVEDHVKTYLKGFAESIRESKLREAVRLAIQTGETLPDESQLDTFIVDQKAAIEAARLSK